MRLLGLDFADLDAAAAAELVAARPASAPFSYVVTPNADHLVRLARHPALRPAYRRAGMRLLDSRAVALAARVLGLATPRVAAGSDLTAELLQRHLLPEERITIVGLRREWLPALMARYRLGPPFHFDPPIGFEHDRRAWDDAVRFVVTHPARLVFLAVGSPRQELLAAAIAATGEASGTALCIGAGLEFLVGAHRRAPVWLRQAGLEWLFRLAADPSRLARRYLRDSPAVLPLLLRERTKCFSAPWDAEGQGEVGETSDNPDLP